MTTVVFVQTVHAADDERVWYHQVASLRKWDCRVAVVAPFATHVSDSDVILYSPQDFSRVQLMRHLSAILSQLHPDVVVCDTPMAICSAKIYSRKHKQAVESFTMSQNGIHQRKIFEVLQVCEGFSSDLCLMCSIPVCADIRTDLFSAR